MDNRELVELIIKLATDNKGKESAYSGLGSKIKIVVYQRGWVAIGRYSEEGDKCILRDAHVIRKWGTTKGLGQLALEGRQGETELDKTGVIRALKLTTVNIIDCDDSKWTDL